jgi:hypothetical protein
MIDIDWLMNEDRAASVRRRRDRWLGIGARQRSMFTGDVFLEPSQRVGRPLIDQASRCGIPHLSGKFTFVDDSQADTGHLFIIEGDLTQLACDAILVPSSRKLGLKNWPKLNIDRSTLSWASESQKVMLARPAQGDDGQHPAVWIGDVGLAGDSAYFADFEAVVTDYVTQAAVKAQAGGAGRRPWGKTRLALPFIGTRHGGGKQNTGEIVERLVKHLERLAETRNVDIILVARSHKRYAAAQRARKHLIEKTDGNFPWRFAPDANPELQDCAQKLADEAIASQLVLFIGSGVGAGARLPTWAGLLSQLASKAKYTSNEIKRLEKKDARDQATLIERRFEMGSHQAPEDDDRCGIFRKTVADILQRPCYGLSHGLLASLRSREAVTTNFDELFETAARANDPELAVLPTEPASEGRWLLKLHGTVSKPDTIVLTRSDFLEVPRTYGALIGLVQGLLLTRYMMFVGYSLSDEDFHELIHEVRQARGPAKGRGSAILTLFTDPLEQQLWEDEFDIIPMMRYELPTNRTDAGEAILVAGRQLELFIDLVGYHSTTSAPFFLDPTYEYLVRDEKQLAATLTDLATSTENSPHDSVARMVHRFLKSLGAEEEIEHGK